MKKTTFIYDFDFTLARTDRAILTCFRAVLDPLGAHPSDDAIRRTIGYTLEDAFGMLLGETDPARCAELRRQYVAQADKRMVAMTEFYPETLAVLRAVRAAGGRNAVLSTKYRYRIEQSFDKENVRDLIACIVGGEDVTAHKPDPEGLEKAIRLLGAQKDECVYVGDHTVDAQAAQAAGVAFVGVCRGTTPREALEAFPHIAVSETLDVLRTLL